MSQDRIAQLEAAIRTHRDQRGDDRCWLDDQKLYEVLGDGNTGDNALPPKEKFLANCSRFYDNRCRNAGWKSYQELEQALEKVTAALSISRGQWYHSVNRDQCLEALAIAEATKSTP